MLTYLLRVLHHPLLISVIILFIFNYFIYRSLFQVHHDWLDLRVPVWVSDIRFLPDSEQVVTCTGHHQVAERERDSASNIFFFREEVTVSGVARGVPAVGALPQTPAYPAGS